MVYLVFESSKGRKDLVFVSSSAKLVCDTVRDWSLSAPSFTYRVYSVLEDFQTFYIDKLSPCLVYRNGVLLCQGYD